MTPDPQAPTESLTALEDRARQTAAYLSARPVPLDALASAPAVPGATAPVAATAVRAYLAALSPVAPPSREAVEKAIDEALRLARHDERAGWSAGYTFAQRDKLAAKAEAARAAIVALVTTAPHGTTETREDRTRVTPDDEIVANGEFHMERMSDSGIWFSINGVSFNLGSTRGKLTWYPGDSEAWPEAADLQGATETRRTEMLRGAIQEQYREIESLRERLAALQGTPQTENRRALIDALYGRIGVLESKLREQEDAATPQTETRDTEVEK